MKNINSSLPTADFFDFETYTLPHEQTLNWSSDNSKTIVVYLYNATNENIQLLAKIFQAVNKSIEKDAYVINGQTLQDLPPIKTALQVASIKKILIFGINPKDISLHATVYPYQLFNFQNKQFLFSHDLNVIATDLNRKKELWGQLQLMFA